MRVSEPNEIERQSQLRIIQLINDYCGGSQREFADKVKIGASSVSQYVNGTNFPTNVRAAQIAETFNVNPMWVMGFNVPKEVPQQPADNTVEYILTPDEKEILSYYREIKQNSEQFSYSTYKRLLMYATKIYEMELQMKKKEAEDGKS